MPHSGIKNMAYRVHLENFEGPLDLLLFLIKKNEVDLFNIPVAEITRQYLEYLEIIQLLDLEGAGDFILMAATLIRIKAKMLLPKPPVDTEEEEEDPREELVRRLLEYQRFKEVAHNMKEMENLSRQRFPRGYVEHDFNGETDTVWTKTDTYTLFDLMGVFRDLLRRMPKTTQHNIELVPATIEDQAAYILAKLDENEGQILFYEMLEEVKTRILMIVTFLALLELIKLGEVRVTQSSVFGEIWVQRTGWKSIN